MKRFYRLMAWMGMIGVALLLTIIMRGRVVQASPTHELLQESLSRLKIPQAGQIAHYRYQRFMRQPPAHMEPDDPYHLPYAALWPDVEVEDSWIEVGTDGHTTRWRTQLRQEDGLLLQDLLFDGAQETDYFPTEGRAEQFSQSPYPFRDNRIALIEDFLQQEGLTQRSERNLQGDAVVAIYTEMIPTEAPLPSVPEALLSLARPFVADLDVAGYGRRVDFDPATLLPVGEAQVAWDQAGTAHVLTYRTIDLIEIIERREGKTLFQQDIPTHAFQPTLNFPPQPMVPLKEAAAHLAIPLHYRASSQPWRLTTPMVPLPNPQQPALSARLQQVAMADSLGIAVRTIYEQQEGKGIITLMEGPTAPMGTLLRRTPPRWVQADRVQVRVGKQQWPAWQLQGTDPTQQRYVIETGASLLWVDSRDVSPSHLVDFLATLSPTTP